MANEIKLVTASGQTVTPQDDALIYEKFATGNGIIYGCEVTIKNSNTLHINAGHGIVCGRKFTVTDSDIPVTLSSSGTLNGRLYIHLDLSLLSDPIVLNTEIANTLTPEVHGSNVNINNGIYDINLVTFTVDTLTIDNLTDVAPQVSGSVGDAIIGNTDISAIGDGTLTGIAKDLDDAIGNTDISAIGDGTVTGAISELNADIAYNNIKNQSISLVANTLTDIIEFTVDHPVVLSVFYATTASTDKLEIFIYLKNNGSYTNIAGVVCNNLATVIPAGTFKVTLRCNTAQTSRPCIISYR